MKLWTLLFIGSWLTSCAQDPRIDDVPITEYSELKTELIASGIEIPWGMAWLPNGDMLVTEKEGTLYRIHAQEDTTTEHKKTRITGVPEVYLRGQGGLLDVLVHPQFEQNNWIYLSYASEEGPGEGGHTAIARATLQNDQLTDLRVLYKATPNTTAGQHFGSRMVFGADSNLYFTIGERGERDINPQDLQRDGGKVYHMTESGAALPSPFQDALPHIYSYGHRNPQGMILHPETNEIWLHEHGPRGGDEINIVAAGANYGWPLVTYGTNYSGTEITDQRTGPGFTAPIYYWVPSIAPSGFAIITGDKYPEWNGNLLVGSLKFRYLEMLELDGKTVIKRTKLLQDIGRVRDVRLGPDGYIYVAVEGKGILRVVL